MKHTTILLIILLASGYAHAQSDTLQKSQFSLYTGTSVVSSPFGSFSLFGVAPSFVFRPSEKLTVKTTIGIANSFSLARNGYHIQGHQPRSLEPLRHSGSGTLGSFALSASYKVTDRLWLAASLHHLAGEMPLFFQGQPTQISLTAFSAHARYKLSDDSYIQFNATFINDPTGALPPYNPFYPYNSYYPYSSFYPYGPLSPWDPFYTIPNN